jgi:putative hemolysin
MKKLFLVLCFAVIFVLTGCQNSSTNKPVVTPVVQTPAVENNTATNEQNTAIANPASTNCIDKGGKLEMRKNKNGEYGVCLFEDNRQCEEWALLRDQCPEGGVKITGYDNDAEIYCAITGGQAEGVGTENPMCKRIDGTLCNAQANLDGECPDPNDPNPNAGNMEAVGDAVGATNTATNTDMQNCGKEHETIGNGINQCCAGLKSTPLRKDGGFGGLFECVKE